MGQHVNVFVNNSCFTSLYTGQFKITCNSFSIIELSQNGQVLDFSGKPSYRPVSILMGATPSLNLQKAEGCLGGSTHLQYGFVSYLVLNNLYTLNVLRLRQEVPTTFFHSC